MTRAERTIPDRASLAPDTPLRLDVAIRMAFPDSKFTLRQARAAIDDGRLIAYRIGGGAFLTRLSHLYEMPRRQRTRPRGASRTTMIGVKGYLYVIGFNEYIKIGFSKRNPWRRIATIQVGCPVELIVYKTTRGSIDDEAHIHALFSDDRLRGEWFRKSDALRAWILAGCPL